MPRVFMTSKAINQYDSFRCAARQRANPFQTMVQIRTIQKKNQPKKLKKGRPPYIIPGKPHIIYDEYTRQEKFALDKTQENSYKEASWTVSSAG